MWQLEEPFGREIGCCHMLTVLPRRCVVKINELEKRADEAVLAPVLERTLT